MLMDMDTPQQPQNVVAVMFLAKMVARLPVGEEVEETKVRHKQTSTVSTPRARARARHTQNSKEEVGSYMLVVTTALMYLLSQNTHRHTLLPLMDTYRTHGAGPSWSEAEHGDARVAPEPGAAAVCAQHAICGAAL